MEAVTKEERWGVYPLILGFTILALGIVVGGTFYYRHFERHFRGEIESQLFAITQLKVDELEQYRKERLDDAAAFFNNTSFSALVRRFFNHPEDADAQQQIQEWAVKFVATGQYDLVRLLDAQGVSRLSLPAGAPPVSSGVLQDIPKIFRSGQIAFEDFHRNENDKRIYLDILIPILDELDTSRPLGVFYLRIDPEKYLYPFIQRWPTPSRTAETLLVRRDGSDALFLNELKFKTNAALNLRISLEKTNMPAVKAVLGQTGIVEGTDYHGEPVIACVCAVPDSPWFMVARMDVAEVYAALYERLWMIILLVGALLLCAGLGVTAIWRHQHAQLYKERSKMAEAMRVSDARYSRLFEAAKDGILILDAETGMVMDVNPFLTRLLGCSQEQFLGKKFWELGFFKDIVASQSSFAELQRKESVRYEDMPLKTADGRWINVEFASNIYLVNRRKVMQCNIRDITERKQAEAVQTRLVSIMEASPDFVGYADAKDGRILYINRSGRKMVGIGENEDLSGVKISDVHPEWVNRKLREELMPAASREGFWSGESALLHRDGREIPVEMVLQAHRSPGGIVEIFSTVSRDITERKRAEDELRQSNETLAGTHRLLQAMLDNIPDRIYFKDAQSRFLKVNRTLARRIGLDNPEDAVGKTDFDFQPPDRAREFYEDEQKIIQTGVPLIDKTEKQILPNGEIVWSSTTKVPLLDPSGKVVGLVGINRDITEHKKAEEALANERALLRALVDNMPMSVYLKDLEGRKTLVNPLELEYLGATSEAEVVGKTDFDFYPKDQAEKYRATDQEIIRSGKPLINLESAFTKPDGSVIHLLGTVVPVRDATGRVIGVAGMNFDITDRKRAEEALANERALLRTLVDNMPMAVYLKDLEGRKTLVNRLELEYLGATSEAEVIGKTDFDFYPKEQAEQYRATDQKIIRSGQPMINGELTFTKHDGSVINLLGSVIPVRDVTGRVSGLAGMNFDITDRKRAEERLLRVVTQTRCILSSGHVTAPEGWRKHALEPKSPFQWDFPVQNVEAAQKIIPLEVAAGEQYVHAWERSRDRADAAQMNWNSGNAFLNELPFYRNEFRCTDKHGVGHWLQEFVTVQKLAENRWEVFGIGMDISDLKRIEMEARESQALYHSLVDQMPTGVFRKDANGRFTFVNSMFCQLKEMPPEKFLGKTIMEVGLPDGDLAARGESHHAMIMRTGKQIEDDEIFCTAEGEARNYHCVKSPVFDSAGKIVGTQGILFDNTDRKRAEQKLEQAFQCQRGISWLHENLLASRPLRDKLQLVTETIVRLFDADFCRIWLMRPGDLCEQGCMHASVTKGPHACLHHEMCLHLMASAGRYTHLDGAKHRRIPYGAYKIGSIAAGKESKFLTNDVQQDPLVHDREWARQLGLVSFAGYRLQSPGGIPLGVLALFAKRPLTAQEDVLLEGLSNATTSVLLTHLAEDKTQLELIERKRAEEALQWNETQLHVTLESTADGILAMDSKGKVIKANKRFAKMWQISRSIMDAGDDHALLDFVARQLSDSDAFLKKVQSLYKSDAVEMDTLAFKDGRIFERYTSPMMMGKTVTGRVWAFRDITQRKRQEKELSDKNIELERFTYTVSHDLKSPLVTVKTFLGYLEQDLAGSDPERVKQDVAYMNAAADKMRLLLEELLNLARVGRKTNPPERVAFKELVQEVLRVVAGRVSNSGTVVQVADADMVLEGDLQRLMEIWQNLVENACKFMGNQARPQVEIGVEKRGAELVFYVRDNGMGIEPSLQAKVFGLFEKLDPKAEGTGMGLALVKRIVELYEGRVWVESAGLGQGAKFLFTLPRAVILDPEQAP